MNKLIKQINKIQNEQIKWNTFPAYTKEIIALLILKELKDIKKILKEK